MWNMNGETSRKNWACRTPVNIRQACGSSSCQISERVSATDSSASPILSISCRVPLPSSPTRAPLSWARAQTHPERRCPYPHHTALTPIIGTAPSMSRTAFEMPTRIPSRQGLPTICFVDTARPPRTTSSISTSRTSTSGYRRRYPKLPIEGFLRPDIRWMSYSTCGSSVVVNIVWTRG